MRHKFDITKMLTSVIGLKGLYYPGVRPQANTLARSEDFSIAPTGASPKLYTAGGSPLRREDPEVLGSYFFMPVTIGGIEIPNAVISISGRKTIVETPLVGRRGSIKELISVDDYQIEVTGVLIGSDADSYPEDQVESLRDLWRRDESVVLISALSDLILEQTDKIVLKSIDFPAVGAYENAQIVKLSAVSDQPFELEII